jgi:hypothetical protein
MNIFEKATRKKVRFDTAIGMLDVEALWDLPLKHHKKVDLNSIAIVLYKQLKDTPEIDFVDDKSNSNSERTQLKFDIVKHIIEVKKKENTKALEALRRKEQKRLISQIIAEKENEELKSASLEDLKAQLKALS